MMICCIAWMGCLYVFLDLAERAPLLDEACFS